MGDKERFAEDLLDRALRRYHSEEPRAGLEGRILAGARARGRAERWRGASAWVWALGAAAALTVIAMVISLLRLQHAPIPTLSPSPAPLGAARPAPPPPALVGERSALPISAGQVPRAGYRAPRLTLAAHRPEQFPTPTPLTQQEKLLLAFIEAIPKSELSARSEQTQEIEIPELSIAALDIKPLPGPLNGQEEK